MIVGGTSGIGLDIASWLPEKGAKNIILVSRSGVKTESAEQTVQDLTRQGVNVEVCRCDVADKQSVEQNLVPLLARMPPVRGVVYGAMVLRVSSQHQTPNHVSANPSVRTPSLKRLVSRTTRL